MAADMLNAPEFAYTDRHVREDPDLRTWAEGYVRIYGGSFEPLVNAKRELRMSSYLATSTVRVVLNCARHDQNFRDQMPQPKPPTLELVKTVASLGPFCDNPRPHSKHWGERIKKNGRFGHGYEECPGVPWEINREIFYTTAHLKRDYAAAHSSNIYHAVGDDVAWIEWHPPIHEMGQARAVSITVKLVCLYPSVLKDPLLFADEPTTLLSTIKKKPGFRTRCPNGCFPDE